MAWRVKALLLTWLALAMPLAHADQTPARSIAPRSAAEDDVPPRLSVPSAAYAPPAAPFGLARLVPPAPLTLFSALSCIAALVSCACSVMLWRRVDAGQEAAKASMYAAGKLFDNAARRFTRSQDEAGSAVEAAAGAAGQAGQAAARLAAAVRETESRLSACLGDGEARLRDAADFVSRYENAAAGIPALLGEAMDRISAHAVPAIEDAAAALRGCAEAVSACLSRDMQKLPDLITDALAAADARGAEAVQAAAQSLQGSADRIADAAGAAPAVLSEAASALTRATAALGEAQARHTALITRVEALAGLLPSIATSLASTAAGQRQLLSQGQADARSGVQEMRHAASCLSTSVDEAATLLRGAGQAPGPSRLSAAPAAMHPALRPHDFARPEHADSPARGQLHTNEESARSG